jgi:hypothetical protein
MYASLLGGLGSHKDVQSPLLRFYYWKPVLFMVCSCTEMWYVSLYALSFTQGPLIMGVPMVSGVFVLCTPFFIFKQVANFVQLAVAADALVAYDARKAS